MKINNTKIKKNIDSERNKKIKKYNLQLIKLFEKLLNETEPSNLFDDVKISYIHFIDKSIIYLDNLENNDELNDNITNDNDTTNNINNETKISIIETEDNLLNNKINDMMNRCYDERYYEIIMKEQEKEIYDENEEYEEDEEDDEDKEY
jgi:hypothetical protein